MGRRFSFRGLVILPATCDDNDGRAAVTDKYLIAQCFFAHSTDLMRKTNRGTWQDSGADYYRNRLEKIKAAFRKEYMTANGKLVPAHRRHIP